MVVGGKRWFECFAEEVQVQRLMVSPLRQGRRCTWDHRKSWHRSLPRPRLGIDAKGSKVVVVQVQQHGPGPGLYMVPAVQCSAAQRSQEPRTCEDIQGLCPPSRAVAGSRRLIVQVPTGLGCTRKEANSRSASRPGRGGFSIIHDRVCGKWGCDRLVAVIGRYGDLRCFQLGLAWHRPE
ncbi:hypothetical protein LZ30DRAFT_204730 [Colletotrichum cereale]|nr:hypothetical protein LZ30DRAFT_204730 [Colletotrichum cereale]